MSLTNAQLKTCRAALAENEAERMELYDDQEQDVLLGTSERRRVWDYPTSENANLLIEYLDQYTSAKNQNPQSYVTDPICDGEIMPGIWRYAGSQRIKRAGKTYIMQSLRRGFLQTLLKSDSTVDWSEARVVHRDNAPISEDYLVIEWLNVDLKVSEKVCTTELNANSFTNVFANGVPYPGTWHKQVAISEPNPQDGSAVVRLLVSRPQYTVVSYRKALTEEAEDVYYYFSVPKPLVAGILTTHNVEGADAAVDYDKGAKLADITVTVAAAPAKCVITIQTEAGCQELQYSDYYYSYSTAEMDAAVTVAIAAKPAGWIYDVSAPGRLANGRFAFTIRRTQAVAATATAYNAEDDVDQTTLVQEKKNQTAAEACVAYVQGVINRVRNALNRFCTYDVDKTRWTSKPTTVRFTITTWSGHTEEHVFAYWQRVTGFSAAFIQALHSVAPLATGTQLRMDSFHRNSDGTFSWHSVVSDNENGTPFDPAVTFNTYTTPIYRTVYISTVLHDQVSYHEWVHTLQRFDNMQDAYDYVAGGTILSSGSGVSGSGNAYLGEKIEDNGWTVWEDI